MANDAPFDIRLITTLKKLLSSDANQIGTNDNISFGTLLGQMFNANGFFGDSFLAGASSGMNVQLQSGCGIGQNQVPTTTWNGYQGLDLVAAYLPIVLKANTVIPIGASAGGQNRIDLIEVALPNPGPNSGVEPFLVDQAQNLTLQPATGAATGTNGPQTVTFDVSNSLGPPVPSTGSSTTALSVKQGAYSFGVPTKPSGTAGYVPVAYVYVGAGVTSIAASAITDARNVLFPEVEQAPTAWLPTTGVLAGQRVLGVAGTPGVNTPPIVFEALTNGTTGASVPTWPSAGPVVDNTVTWESIGPYVSTTGVIDQYLASFRTNFYGTDNELGVDLLQLPTAPNSYPVPSTSVGPGYCMQNTISDVTYAWRCLVGGVTGSSTTFVNPASSTTPNNTTQLDGSVVWWCVGQYYATQVRLLTTNYATGALDPVNLPPANIVLGVPISGFIDLNGGAGPADITGLSVSIVSSGRRIRVTGCSGPMTSLIGGNSDNRQVFGLVNSATASPATFYLRVKINSGSELGSPLYTLGLGCNSNTDYGSANLQVAYPDAVQWIFDPTTATGWTPGCTVVIQAQMAGSSSVHYGAANMALIAQEI